MTFSTVPDEFDADLHGVCEECGEVFSHDEMVRVTISSPGQVWAGSLCFRCADAIDEHPRVEISRPRVRATAPATPPAPEP